MRNLNLSPGIDWPFETRLAIPGGAKAGLPEAAAKNISLMPKASNLQP